MPRACLPHRSFLEKRPGHRAEVLLAQVGTCPPVQHLYDLRMSRWWVRFLNFGVAIGALAATCLALRGFAPPEIPVVSEKWRYFQAHRDDFDTVFIGSSRIYHGISPRIFDETTTRAGRPTHSFNLAADGMFSPESVMLARRVAKAGSPHLRRIFVEISGREIMNDQRMSVRDAYWHGLDSASYALRTFVSDVRVGRKGKPLPVAKAWRELQTHWRLCAMNFTNEGRFLDAWARLTGSPPAPPAPHTLGPAGDGFDPFDYPMPEKAIPAYREFAEQLRAGKAPKRIPDPANRDAFARLAKLAARQGISLILVVTPVMIHDFHAKVDAPDGVTALALDDAVAYPDFYRQENRIDGDHLNGASAENFTRLLAQRYLETPGE